MAASVDDRSFSRLVRVPNGVVPLGCSNNIISDHNAAAAAAAAATWPEKQIPWEDEDWSSGEEDGGEAEDEWRISIVRGKAELEPSILEAGMEDGWVERNPSMIRLTGKHPFNSEPPLTRLMHHGFITPAPLHYVRNHGPVPVATWHNWTIEVCGLVKRPARFSMDRLVSEFPSREFPATLVCAGNRRKEQNMVKQTIGFNWGAGAVSTSLWRGVPLWCILKRCGILSRRKGALNVCFEGAEDLPGGGGGSGGSKYGTSIRAEIAMDPSRDIIVAYMQNGERLAPDHGFPVRMILPGFIGGRMVKWLKRIIVTTKESQSYYHFKDNRVLPSHVDAELANSEAWWYKPDYIINELNTNSVITAPSHDEILPINSWTTQSAYTLRGYAYSGGGKKLTRVEVTMDGGETWHVCDVERPEKPNKYGKYWCWCFWSLDLEVLELLGAKEIAVRAWDETHNTQPEKLNWNLMGMMNNCWFRVKASVCKAHKKGEIGIRFEHPAQPGNNPGGWMAREKHLRTASDPAQTLKKSVSTPFMNTAAKTYSLSDLKKHNTADSAWIAVHGHVYDCTRFLKDHPGGADSILINAGTDATEEFDAIHSDRAKKLLEDYRIGELAASPYDSAESSPENSVHGASDHHLAPIKETSAPALPTRACALVPREKIQCRLVSRAVVSRDVRRLRFALPCPGHVLGLPVGKHILVCATVNDKLCMRAYTPTSAVDEVGYFDLVVRIYFKGEHPKFPDGGLMSQYLESLPVGSTADVKGPTGHIEYTGCGNFVVRGKRKFVRKLAMVAGGTGITPMYQVIQAILRDPHDETEMHLVYACRKEEDILMREELDAWAEEESGGSGGGGRLKVWYVVESAREGWGYSVGFVTEEIMREHLPEATAETLVLACGPPPMMKFAVQPNLEKLGHNVKESLIVF